MSMSSCCNFLYWASFSLSRSSMRSIAPAYQKTVPYWLTHSQMPGSTIRTTKKTYKFRQAMSVYLATADILNLWFREWEL